jgi:hypothetical protein
VLHHVNCILVVVDKFSKYSIYPVAYKLDLPVGSSIYPVFHVSQLKKMVSANAIVSPILPTDSKVYQVSEAVLSTRMTREEKKKLLKC